MYTSFRKSYLKEYQLPLFVLKVPAGEQKENIFHNHEFSEIAIVTQGQATHRAGRKTAKLEAGDVIIMHRKDIHSFSSMVEFIHINIIYDAVKIPIPILDAYDLPLFNIIFPHNIETVTSLPGPVAKLNKENLAKVEALVDELSDELGNIKPGKQFLCMGLFMTIITYIARCERKLTKQNAKLFLIGDAISYINEHYNENITLPVLAKKTNMSCRSLSRHFKNASGTSPIQYLIQVRLNHAARLLLNTNKSIESISNECGFQEENYFIRIFKKYFKLSPYKFRISHRQSN